MSEIIVNKITKCSYADRYKARRKPKCNDGFGCEVCNYKWEQQEKYLTTIKRIEQLEKITNPHYI